jgi:hypothetical protein
MRSMPFSLLDCGPLYALGTPLFTGVCTAAKAADARNKKGEAINCPK